MFINYLKTAVRSLWSHRVFSAINIFGLAVAMSVAMGIMMLVADQLEYDRHNSKRDRIYRIVTTRLNSDGSDGQRNASAAMALRNELLEKYTGIEKVVRLRYGFGNHWLEFEGQDVNIPLAGFYADPEVFDFFEYEFQYGDPTSALKEPYSVVLTRKAANKLFKEENPIGLTIKVGKIGTYTVTGVLKETAKKSHIVFEALASMATIENAKAESREMTDFTDNFNHWTYILSESKTSPTDIQRHLDKIYQEHIAPIADPDVQKMKFGLQPMSEITLGPLINNTIGPMLPLGFVYFLSALAIIILLTSCFNFTNLSIARSLTRAREIGVRKVTGAARWHIFVQFLTESVLVAMVALVIAIVLLSLAKPLLLQLNFARIFRWGLQLNFAIYDVFILFAFVVGILAGLFPAVVLSGFQPVKVLKSMHNLKVFSGMRIRKVLLVSQFALSLFFILSVIIMQNQLKLFINKDHGFNMENNVVVKLNGTAPQTLKTELLKHSDIQTVTAASHVAASGPSHINGFKKTPDEKDWTTLNYFIVDEDYLKNMGLKLVAGKFYVAEQEASNKNYVVINEEAVRKLQYGSPLDAIGEEIISQSDSARKTIIGVVANYNHRALLQTISPLALMNNPSQFNLLQVGYSGNYENAIRNIERAWATVNPGLKIEYNTMKSEIGRFYEIVFGDIVKILGVVSFLSILISCLGLLGMATYMTETRMREISIRKVLGSDNTSLVLLLSKGFFAVLALAVAIGVPAAYFVNNLWLELIAYRTSVSPLIIGQGVLILLLFGVLTVGSQTIRATFANPVNSLKID